MHHIVQSSSSKNSKPSQRQQAARLAVKIDVDTDRGTREGVPALLDLCRKYQLPATFLFSLGPDNTGKAIRRVFRPGFLKKVTRTNVAGNYGLRTLLNGTLLPAPDIGKRNASIMQAVAAAGLETGIHCFDHFQWQDYLHLMSAEEIQAQLSAALDAYRRIFSTDSNTAGAPGWQANAHSFAAYDKAQFLYGSDTRGSSPFYPHVDGTTFRTLQIPTTLPTLDELLGRPEFPLESLVDHYLRLLEEPKLHVMTIHAELEGMAYLQWFERLIRTAQQQGIAFASLTAEAQQHLRAGSTPVCAVLQESVDGRSGTLAVQGPLVADHRPPSPH